MNILVINGSPKGAASVTLQSMLYLEKIFAGHAFSYFHAGQKIKAIEKDFGEAAEAIGKADLIIFAYPVYTFLIPYQLFRFVELAKMSGVDVAGKWATQFSTSKHFYDTTAHRFLKENMLDLGFKVLPGLSADMEDLLKKEGQKQLVDWLKMSELRISQRAFEGGARRQERAERRSYAPSLAASEKTLEGRVSIVTNAESDDAALLAMIEDFRSSLQIESKVFNMAEYPFSAGCISCFRCARSGKCAHKDGFDSYLRGEVQNARAIVYAWRIKNHYTGSVMKCYDDRQFCNGHRTVTEGTPTAYLVAGPLSDEPNLRDVIEARASVGGNYLAAVITDEGDIAKDIRDGAERLCAALKENVTEPQNFFGAGGSKIFRDLIYEMRGLMRADHKFYKMHGRYNDLPTKHKRRIVMMQLVGLLMALPFIPRKASMMTRGMLTPYKKVIKAAAQGKARSVTQKISDSEDQ